MTVSSIWRNKQWFKSLWVKALRQYSGLSLLIFAMKRFGRLGHKTHAAALTYTTLFALVPLLTVTYSVLSMIPSLQQGRGDIETMLMGNLVPASGDALMGYLHQFSQQAQQLTAVGIVLLVVTAFMMLRTIENTFNQIWQLKQGRKGVASFLLYWAILSLGPLMLSAGLAVSSYIASLGLWQEDWVPSSGVLVLAVIIPYFTSFLAFTLIYWAVPNCNVPLRHAAIGGALIALFFEVGQEVFAEATTFFPSYQLIYGAFAAVPLFLLWVYISWIVILLGAEIVYLQSAGIDDQEDSSATYQEVLGLQLLALLKVQQDRGEGLNIHTMKLALAENSPVLITSANLMLAINKLLALKLIIKTAEHYYLIRDLSHYPLYEYLQHLPAENWLLVEADNTSLLRATLIAQNEKLKVAWSGSLLQYLPLIEPLNEKKHEDDLEQ